MAFEKDNFQYNQVNTPTKQLENLPNTLQGSFDFNTPTKNEGFSQNLNSRIERASRSIG